MKDGCNSLCRGQSGGDFYCESFVMLLLLLLRHRIDRKGEGGKREEGPSGPRPSLCSPPIDLISLPLNCILNRESAVCLCLIASPLAIILM